jgi:hypothetical protein
VAWSIPPGKKATIIRPPGLYLRDSNITQKEDIKEHEKQKDI